MPEGKPAGVRCVQLAADFRCLIFADPRRPKACAGLRPQAEMCGDNREFALVYLHALEHATG